MAEFDVVDASRDEEPSQGAKAGYPQPSVDRHFVLDLAVRLHAGVALGPVDNSAVIGTARAFEQYLSETTP